MTAIATVGKSDEPDWTELSADTAIPHLVDRYGGQLYGLGLKFCGSEEEAHDLVQDVFLQAFRSWDQFQGRSKVTTWLYTIASRACRRRHRRRAGEPTTILSFDELLPGRDGYVPMLREDYREPFDDQMKLEARDRVEVALGGLPTPFRMAVVLKDIVELSTSEVADVLDLKEATVKTRVHRGRLLLRKELAEGFPGRPSARSDRPPQVCLDLLRAKLDALDRGVDLPVPQEELCARCGAMFDSLDLAREVCHDLGREGLPSPVRALLDQDLQAAVG